MRAIYVIGALLALMVLAAPVAAASVEPVLFPDWKSGNAASECKQAGCECPYAYKIDNWEGAMNGEYKANGNTFTISNGDGATFDWVSDFPVCAVIVKAGQGANVYYYSGAYSDTGLVAPEDKGISHVTFCFSDPPKEELTVTKTAVTSYTRTHEWSIDKSVETEKECTHEGYPKIWLYVDGTGDETATWTVDVTHEGYTDSNHKVTGVITIENTGSTPATITKIEDLLGDTPVTVDCGEAAFPYTLPVGETLTCTYCADGFVEGTNKVTVTTARGNEYSASVPIVWLEPTNEFYKTVTIKDVSDLFGERNFGSVTAPDGGHFTYTKDFAWTDYGKGGDFTYGNTAFIVETEQSADATLKVNVQGYSSETAYAKGDSAVCFIPTFNNWGWTNPITPGEYTWPLWAGAGQCETSRGTLVGTVTVDYGADGKVSVTYDVPPNILENTHVYAGYDPFPKDRKGNPTVAPGQYTNEGPFDGTTEVYVIAHAVVRIPDPNFGPQPPI